jgi:hypothetical protein
MNRCDAISYNMTTYRNLYYYLEGTFDGCLLSNISRTNNEEADHLANIGSQCLPVPPEVFWEEIMERSIKENKTSSTSKPRKYTTADLGEHDRARGCHDGRGNLDAAIFSIYDQ